MLPPSAVQTSAEDDTDAAGGIARARPNTVTSSSRRGSQENNNNNSNNANSGVGGAGGSSGGASTAAPVVRRISSLPLRVGSPAPAAAAAVAAADAGGQQQQQTMLTPHRSSFDAAAAAAAAAQHPVHENPLNVVLAARADQIGDNPEAIRRELLAMKLASGALQFDNAVSTFAVALPGSAGSPDPRVASRLASFSALVPTSSRNSISSRTGGIGATVTSADAAVAHAAATAAAAAAEAGGVGTSGVHDAASPFASAQEQQQPHQQRQAGADQQQQQQATLSPSPSLFNLTAANVIAQQPSQSLQRLLSGNLRGGGGRRANSTALPLRQQQSASPITPSFSPQPTVQPPTSAGNSCDIAGTSASLNSSSISPAVGMVAPPAGASAGGGGGVAGVAAAGGAGLLNGDLPMLQQSPASAAAAAVISEAASVDEEEDTCEICFDAAAVVALQTCGHTLCVGCCKELCKLHHFKPGLCPYCRY